MDEWDPFFGDYEDYIDPINVGPITPGENMVVTSITGSDMNDPQFDDFSDEGSTSSSTGGFWESLSNAFGSAAGSVLNSAGQAAGSLINQAGQTATGAINNAAGVQTPAQVAANQAAERQKMLMLAAGAVALAAVVYFANRNK